jgi:hypothetical protein
MNIKRIIREEMESDPFKWIKDSDPNIKLKPNTFYYFEPSISGEELKEFTNRFSPGYKKLGRWLRGLTIPVIFFVTDETGKDIQGWSNFVSIKDGMEFYKDNYVDYVNARQYFNI